MSEHGKWEPCEDEFAFYDAENDRYIPGEEAATEHNATVEALHAAESLRAALAEKARALRNVLCAEGHCPWCGWPIKDRVEDGCVIGNCSMRPMPNDLPIQRAIAALDEAPAAAPESRGRGRG